jgi:EAL domain-containing protein (putative c-di-GMP-specific phosphodiesterase class I)
VIKIDRSFISDLGRDAANDTIVAAIIQLAHDLGMAVVAEGVETPEQHGHLRRLGCDRSQGYYFAEPMRSSQLDAFIDHRPGTVEPTETGRRSV